MLACNIADVYIYKFMIKPEIEPIAFLFKRPIKIYTQLIS